MHRVTLYVLLQTPSRAAQIADNNAVAAYLAILVFFLLTAVPELWRYHMALHCVPCRTHDIRLWPCLLS